MYTKNKKTISLLLSLIVMFSMCFAGTIGAFAESGEEQDKVLLQTESLEEVFESEGLDLGAKDVANANYTFMDGQVIKPKSVNSSAEADSYTTYPYTSSRQFTAVIDMPSAGNLLVAYATANGTSVTVKANGSYGSYIGTTDGVKSYAYCLSAGKTNLTFDAYAGNGSDVLVFSVQYAPATNSISAPTGKFSREYTLGGACTTSKTTKFKVKVPSNGYLTLAIEDALDDYSVQIKTSGFKDYEYVNKKANTRYIAVKKGTYTFTVKTITPFYHYKVKFTKVSENKYGAKKKKAKALKRKKASKGLIITDGKKAHWYKFKNKKTKKVRLIINSYVTDAGGYGGLKISYYDKKRCIGYDILREGKTSNGIVKLYTLGKNYKLMKGTYYVKVESYKGGNGYFTVKWK